MYERLIALKMDPVSELLIGLFELGHLDGGSTAQKKRADGRRQTCISRGSLELIYNTQLIRFQSF